MSANFSQFIIKIDQCYTCVSLSRTSSTYIKLKLRIDSIVSIMRRLFLPLSQHHLIQCLDSYTILSITTPLTSATDFIGKVAAFKVNEAQISSNKNEIVDELLSCLLNHTAWIYKFQACCFTVLRFNGAFWCIWAFTFISDLFVCVYSSLSIILCIYY